MTSTNHSDETCLTNSPGPGPSPGPSPIPFHAGPDSHRSPAFATRTCLAEVLASRPDILEATARAHRRLTEEPSFVAYHLAFLERKAGPISFEGGRLHLPPAVRLEELSSTPAKSAALRIFLACEGCGSLWAGSPKEVTLAMDNDPVGGLNCPFCVPKKGRNGRGWSRGPEVPTFREEFPALADAWDRASARMDPRTGQFYNEGRTAASLIIPAYGAKLKGWFWCGKFDHAPTLRRISHEIAREKAQRLGRREAGASGCHACANFGGKVAPGSNLADCFPDIAGELDGEALASAEAYTKLRGRLDIPDNLTPSEVRARVANSLRPKVAISLPWVCKTCGKTWMATAGNRTHRHSGCPHCVPAAVSRLAVRIACELRFVLPDLEIEAPAGVGALKVDMLLRDRLVVMELDGAYWHAFPSVMARDLKRIKRLRDAGYTVLRLRESPLPEEDVDDLSLPQLKHVPPRKLKEVVDMILRWLMEQWPDDQSLAKAADAYLQLPAIQRDVEATALYRELRKLHPVWEDSG